MPDFKVVVVMVAIVLIFYTLVDTHKFTRSLVEGHQYLVQNWD